MSDYPLNPDLYSDEVKKEPIRAGFGRGLKGRRRDSCGSWRLGSDKDPFQASEEPIGD